MKKNRIDKQFLSKFNNTSTLYSVIINNQLEALNYLINKKPDGTYQFPKIVAHMTACENEKETLKDKIHHLVIDKHPACYYRLNPLYLAIASGSSKIANRLLAKNTDGVYEFPDLVASLNTEHSFLLILATNSGETEIIRRLL